MNQYEVLDWVEKLSTTDTPFTSMIRSKCYRPCLEYRTDRRRVVSRWRQFHHWLAVKIGGEWIGEVCDEDGECWDKWPGVYSTTETCIRYDENWVEPEECEDGMPKVMTWGWGQPTPSSTDPGQ